MFFVSDNAGPVAPQVMKALERANQGYANPYGADESIDRVRQLVRDIFEAPQAEVFLVATGTAANALSLATLAKPWEVIFCHNEAHINKDECCAPEFFTDGAKLVGLSGASAKIDPSELTTRMAKIAAEGVPEMQTGPLSLTQTTEAGTVYSRDQIRELTTITKAKGGVCHMDGARFANALVSLGCSPAEMTWKSGIDVVSFGGTKNGLMGVEAVVLFNPDHAREFQLRRKRGGHTFSKSRFPAAQMEAYLTDGLWLELAAKANASAAKLEAGILDLPGGMLMHQRDANMVFCGFHRKGHRAVQAQGAYYYLQQLGATLDGPDDDVLTARLVCNWATSDGDIERFLELAKA